MRWPVLAAAMLLAGPALADEVANRVTLRLEVEQAKLIVQTLGAIGCGNVTQMIVCHQAEALLHEMQKQLNEQIK